MSIFQFSTQLNIFLKFQKLYDLNNTLILTFIFILIFNGPI